MLQDKWLIYKLKHGDEDALRAIYEKYKDDLRAIAYSLVKDAEHVEGMLHDVFVSFAENVGKLELKGSLRSYLATCMVNRVRDGFRDRQSKMVTLEAAGAVAAEQEAPDVTAATAETTGILMRALDTIPQEQREVIMLRLKAGMKLREIAEIQGTSLNTVHGRYRYGLEKLRTILDGKI